MRLFGGQISGVLLELRARAPAQSASFNYNYLALVKVRENISLRGDPMIDLDDFFNPPKKSSKFFSYRPLFNNRVIRGN